MIESFKGAFAEAILSERKVPKGLPADMAAVARRRLVQLDAAMTLADMAVPPGTDSKP